MTPTTNSDGADPLGGVTKALQGSVHGPYEDLGIAALNILETVIKDAPPEVKQKLWSDFLTWHTGLQNLASKLDVFHLFTPRS